MRRSLMFNCQLCLPERIFRFYNNHWTTKVEFPRSNLQHNQKQRAAQVLPRLFKMKYSTYWNPPQWKGFGCKTPANLPTPIVRVVYPANSSSVPWADLCIKNWCWSKLPNKKSCSISVVWGHGVNWVHQPCLLLPPYISAKIFRWTIWPDRFFP